MTFREIAWQRVINQQLDSGSIKTPLELITWFGAIQGQEYAQTKWSFGLRIPAITDADIEKDFNEGRILRTHLLRPTWHLVHVKDIRWMLALTAPRVHAANAFMYRKLELDTEFLNRCSKNIVKILEGKHLTRNAIREELSKKKIIAEGLRLGYIMMYAELESIICSGARQGNQFTYSLLEERVKKVKEITKEEALAELTRRYFKSRGPATVHDFATWSGLTLADCKKGIEMTTLEFEHYSIADNVYHFVAPIKRIKNKRIHLLPIYDEFIMGYKKRNAILEFSNSLVPKPVFRFDNTIISNGQIIGTWKRIIKSNQLHIDYHFFEMLSSAQTKEFEKALVRFKAFHLRQ